jgi:hypothetical protein
MKTDELIDRLGRDVTVTKPLPTPGTRTVMWMVWAAMYLVVVTVMMFAVMSSAGVTKRGDTHWHRSCTCRVLVGDPRRERPCVGAAGHRGGDMGRGAVVGRRARSAGVRDVGSDQSERLALRRLNDDGRSRRRGSSRLDVAARRSVDACPHGLPRRAGGVECRQYRGVPDAPACVCSNRPLVAWRHGRCGCRAVRVDGPALVALA